MIATAPTASSREAWNHFPDSFTASVRELSEKCAPPVITWFPKGVHVICPHGETRSRVVMVRPGDAAVANRHLQAIRAKASAGQGRAPFLDLNHNGTMAAEVIECFWDDWGIRASVAWLEPAERAIAAGEVFSFSPLFAADQRGHFFGITTNCGALLSQSVKPAFDRMPPIKAWTKRQRLDFLADRFVRLMGQSADELRKSGMADQAMLRAFDVVKRDRPDLHSAYAFREALKSEVRADVALSNP